MTWYEACKASNERIAIKTVKTVIGYEQTYIVFENGTCITHPVNNPYNERKGPHPDDWDDAWMPAECMGPVYTNEIETGLMPYKTSPEHRKAEEYFKNQMSKQIKSFDVVDNNSIVKGIDNDFKNGA